MTILIHVIHIAMYFAILVHAPIQGSGTAESRISPAFAHERTSAW